MLAIMMQFMVLMVAMWVIPHSRYAAMDNEEAWFNPILFAVMMALLSSLMMCSWQMATTDQWSWEHCLQTLFNMLLLGAGGSLLGAIVLHPIWKFFGSTKNFLASLKSVAWVMALLPLFSFLFLWLQPFGTKSLINVNGVAFGFWPILFFFWSSLLLVLATRIVHNIAFPQAWVAAPIAWIFLPLLFVLLNQPLWTAPIEITVKTVTEQEVKSDQTTQLSDPKQKDVVKQTAPRTAQLDDLLEELGKLVVDNTFLSPLLSPEMNRDAYYSPFSGEGGRRMLGITGYRNSAGQKVVRIQIDPGDINYFYSYAQPSYGSGGASTGSVADEAAASTTTRADAETSPQLQSNANRSVVSEATISIMDESGNEIAGTMIFSQAQQYVLKEGVIYLVGEVENFEF